MLHKLSLTEVTGDKIVDPIIRELVQQQFERLKGTGLKDPAKAFADPGNHPYLTTKKGGLIPIHKVRLAVDVKPKTVGKGHRERFVAPTGGSNHHTAIIAKLDAAGNEVKWEQKLVPRLEAYQRLRDRKQSGKGESDIIQRDWGKDFRFKFFLMPNDCVEMDDASGQRQVYRVCSISQTPSWNEIQFIEQNDARKIGEARSSWNRVNSIDSLRKRKALKVRVTPLGEIVPDE
ncbi:MAG: hypothetical protein FD138_2752 [Planctomycetota bacterium]|nr:MAG: hypothetical protein FD138_2752 [Planctomycetota bacterium]